MARNTFYFDPEAKGLSVFLGPTEAGLMELAWAHKSLTVKKAIRLSDRSDQPAYTTVMTVLSRLASKGLLKRELDGRVYVYRPTQSRRQFLSDRVRLIAGCLDQNFRDYF